MTRRRLTAVAGDVFAGFFTLGVREAGFDVPLHLAHTNYGLKTHQLNFPDTRIVMGVPAWAQALAACKTVDLMFTNPPCASWSAAGVKSVKGVNTCADKWQDDPRSQWSVDLAKAALDLDLDLSPGAGVKTWVWESVVNAWKYGRDFVDEMAERFLNQGYGVTVLLQNNCYLGAPQDRKRMFFIAHRYPLVWPKLAQYPKLAGELLRTKGLKTDGPRLKSPGHEIIHKISTTEKNCMNFSPVYHKFLTDDQRKLCRSIPGRMEKVVHPLKLAPVLMAGNMIHPFEPRYLSVAEYMILSGIPDTWKFPTASYNAAVGEMARAVLPPVGRWLATAVRDGIESGKKNKRPGYVLIDAQDGTYKTEVLR